MFKRFFVGLICVCMLCSLFSFGITASANETAWSVTLRGIDFETTSEVGRGLYLDDNTRPSDNDFSNAHLQMSAPANYTVIDTENGLWAKHEFYVPEAGYYDMSAVMSDYHTGSGYWYSPWYVQINDGTKSDAADIVTSSTQMDSNPLYNVAMKQVYLNAGKNTIMMGTFKTQGDYADRQYMMKIKSVTFTKSATTPSETLSVPVHEGYTIENINPTQVCSTALSIKASGDYYIIQTNDTAPDYDGYRIKYPVYVPKGGVYKLAGAANTYKNDFLSPHKISFDDNAPMDTRQMVVDKTVAVMTPTAYDYGMFYLSTGVHNLVVTVDTTIKNGTGAGYKLTLDDSFTLTPYTTTALTYGGNECTYPVEFTQALQTSDNIRYLYSYASGAVDGNTYDFVYRVTVPESGYYELSYTDCPDSSYAFYNVPSISVNGSSFADTKVLKGNTSVENNVRDLGAVYMEAGKVNTVTIRISGFRTHTDGGYYLMNGGITLAKLTDDIVITAESPLYNATSDTITTGGSEALEHWTYARFTANQTYKVYASEAGVYGLDVYASANLAGVRVNGELYDVVQTVDITTTESAAADKNIIEDVTLAKGENTLELVLKEGAAQIDVDCIRANKKESIQMDAEMINSFRYSQTAGSGNDRRGVVVNAVSNEAMTGDLIIAEYDVNSNVLINVKIVNNQELAANNNVINLDLTDDFSSSMNTNLLRIMLIDDMGTLVPYAKSINFAQ